MFRAANKTTKPVLAAENAQPLISATPLSVGDVAKICHEANRAYCETIGDDSQVSWEDAEEWQQDSAVAGVLFNLENRDAPISATHDSWLKKKTEDGWGYGETKDPKAKTHPCMVPYADLPHAQKAKDVLFRSIVHSLTPFVAKDEDQ